MGLLTGERQMEMKNAALIAASILSLQDPEVAHRLEAFRKNQTETVLKAEI